MNLQILLIPAFFASFTTLASASDIQGTVTDEAPSLVGGFDFYIDTSEDTMTLSNPTGDYADFFAFTSNANTLLLRSHDDFTQSSGQLSLLQSATFDFTGNETSALGLSTNDGFFWVSDEVENLGSPRSHFVIGGTMGLSGPSTDSNVLGAFTVFDPETGARTYTTFGIGGLSVSSEVVPEPSSLVLLGIAGLGLLTRRRK